MAMQPAVLGTARLNNFRLNYLPAALRAIRATRVQIWIDGELATYRVRRAGFTIHDVLNDAPNTCTLTIEGAPPPQSGMALRVLLGIDTPRLLFNGTLQTDGETYQGRPTFLAYPCQGIDDTARLNYRRPIGVWIGISATTIAQELITRFAPGFSAAGVQAGLPRVTVSFDGSEGFSGCLRQIAKLIGGYFYVDDLVVHLFQVEATDAPAPITGAPGQLLDEPPIQVTRDDSQLRTRVLGRGLGDTVRIDLAVGATVIPIDATLFNPPGGHAILSTTPDGSPTEIVAYTGVQLGGGGVIVGPGAAPSVALEPVIASGAGLGLGVYRYGYTFVTSAGESLVSPLASVTTSAGVPDPTVTPSATDYVNGGSFNSTVPIGDPQEYAFTYSTVPYGTGGDMSQQTLLSPSVAHTTVSNRDPLNPTRSAPVKVLVPNSTDPRVQEIYLFLKSPQTGNVFRLVQNVTNNPAGGSQTIITAVATTGTPSAPLANTTAAGRRVTLSGVAIGPAATLARKIYRTIANGSVLQLQQTLANNVTTVGVTDATPDASLGATAPSSDTSGLPQPFGQVIAGSTTIPVTGTSPFYASGGFLETPAGELVRYMGLSAQLLTGIPAVGPGSILTTLSYGSPVVPVPAISGVSGLTKAVLAGSRVHVWVQRDDLAAQAEAAARESTATYTSDGIHEHLIVDERRGDTSLAALCDADLALFARPIVTVVLATRDVTIKSGKPLTIDLPSLALLETLTIQDVTITEIDSAPGLPPRFTVTASSVRFSLEDTLRRLSGLLES